MKRKLLQNTLSLKKGFTLIETLVAISILVIAIVGPMEIASKGLSSAFYARDEITAYYLGQEALEVVRNTRDNAYIEHLKTAGGVSGSWLDPLRACIDDTNGCSVEVGDTDVLVPCSSGSKCGSPLRLAFDVNDEMSRYSYSSGDNTKFKRVVKIIPDSAENSATVEATVSWSTGGVFSLTRQFVIKERLYNWQLQE